jgi:hypothetical protein
LAIEASERHSHSNEGSPGHSHSCEDFHHKSGSGSHSSHEKYIYKCNNNEWVPYLFDDAPTEEGLYYGDSEPGAPGFVGGFLSLLSPARIDVTKKEAYAWFNGDKLINDPTKVFYLKRNCHHKYEWVNSTTGEPVPNALQAFAENASGASVYIGRKKFDDFTAFLTVIFALSTAGYTDKNGANHVEKEYQVLTCKSKVFETPPKTTTAAPGSEDEIVDPNYTGCGELNRRFNNKIDL